MVLNCPYDGYCTGFIIIKPTLNEMSKIYAEVRKLNKTRSQGNKIKIRGRHFQVQKDPILIIKDYVIFLERLLQKNEAWSYIVNINNYTKIRRYIIKSNTFEINISLDRIIYFSLIDGKFSLSFNTKEISLIKTLIWHYTPEKRYLNAMYLPEFFQSGGYSLDRHVCYENLSNVEYWI